MSLGKGEIKTFQEIIDYDHALASGKFECKCGHRVIIPKHVDKRLCSWCKNYVFRDKKVEFEYRMKERLKK